MGYGGRVVGHGCNRNYWGEDFLLENPTLRNEVPACALSFVEAQFIPMEALDMLLVDPRFHNDKKQLRWFKVRVRARMCVCVCVCLWRLAHRVRPHGDSLTLLLGDDGD